MFIAYINRDPSVFLSQLKNSFETHLKSSATAEQFFTAFGALRLPSHLSKAQVQSLAD
jgi:hypothetical protein